MQCVYVHNKWNGQSSADLFFCRVSCCYITCNFAKCCIMQAKQAIEVLRRVSERSKKKVLFPEVDQMLHVQFVYKKPDIKNIGYHRKRM